VVIPLSLDDLREFLHVVPQGEEHATTIMIDALSTPHHMLAKIVQHNLWPVVRRSDLILKRSQFVYAISLRLPFCLCKHILGIILEARDEGNSSLPFGYLLTQIILQSGISIVGKPKMKTQDPISKKTLIFLPASQMWRPLLRLFHHYNRMLVILKYGGIGHYSRGHEFHAALYVIHAAVHLCHAIGGSLHKPPCRVEPTGPPGVSQVASSHQ